MLRNPVDRAYSHYLLERVTRLRDRSTSPPRSTPKRNGWTGKKRSIVRDPAYVSEAHKHVSYLARGDYAPQLERWFAHFPREQMLVLRSEDFFDQPARTFAAVAAFLRIAPDLDAAFATHNKSVGPPLEPALRARLSQHFSPKIVALGELLGRHPGWV